MDMERSDLWSTVGNVAVGVGMKALGIVAIIVGAFVVAWLLRLVIHRVVKRIVEGAKSKANVDDTRAIDASPLAQVRLVQRTRTLGTILQNIVNVTLVIIAVFLSVHMINDSILGSFALLSAAIGAGLGFGAQNIVKDVLNGIFIVAEDQIGIGDVVDVGLATGVVEYVSVRITHVRDVNGTLWYVRNGEITRIGNMSMGWSRVIIDLAVPVDVDVETVETTLLDTAKELAKDSKWRSRIIERPEIWGLESITGDALVIRLVMKTRANAKDDVARELRMRLKHAIDGMGIKLPAMNTITLSGVEGARRVKGANPPRTKPVATSTPERPIWKARKPGKAKKKDAAADDGAEGGTPKDPKGGTAPGGAPTT